MTVFMRGMLSRRGTKKAADSRSCGLPDDRLNPL
jgi:hypothetical protein